MEIVRELARLDLKLAMLGLVLSEKPRLSACDLCGTGYIGRVSAINVIN